MGSCRRLARDRVCSNWNILLLLGMHLLHTVHVGPYNVLRSE